MNQNQIIIIVERDHTYPIPQFRNTVEYGVGYYSAEEEGIHWQVHGVKIPFTYSDATTKGEVIATCQADALNKGYLP